MNKDDYKTDATHVERTTSPVTSFDSDVKTGHQDGIQQMLDQGQHIGFAAATEEGEALLVAAFEVELPSLTFFASARLLQLRGSEFHSRQPARDQFSFVGARL